MPQAIVAIVQQVVVWVGANAVRRFVAQLVISALLSLISSKLFGPKRPKGVGLNDKQITVRSALEYRKVIYGEAMVSGPVVYQNVAGPSGFELWTVIPMCDGLSEDLIAIHLDGDVIPKADIDWAAGTGAVDGTGTGNVSTVRWVGDGSYVAAQIFYYLGDDAQPVCAALSTAIASPEITTDFRLRGVTYVVFKFKYAPASEKVWVQGVPTNMKARIKGRKIYDPRLDSTVIIDSTTSPITYGSGAHRYTDATTWAWSDNPALCVADYLTQYMATDPVTRIDWPSIASAADSCEVQVVTGPATSPETMGDRFTCNGSLSMGETHKDNLDSLLSSMDGRISYTGGVWRVRASVWEASSTSIDLDDMSGDISVRGSAPMSDRFNKVRGFFVDPGRGYQAAEFQHVTNATYLTRDNSQVIEYDLQLPFTNNEFMAQRIAHRVLKQGNNQVLAEMSLNARGAKIAVGDVIDVTVSELSWTAKTFRVISWALNADGTYKVIGREDSAASYTDPTLSEYGGLGASTITVPADVVPPPTGLAAAATVAGIKLTWTNPASTLFDYIEVYESASSAWSGASLIASVRTDTLEVAYGSGVARWFWVRARNFTGQTSLRSPDTDTSTVTATSGITIGTNGSATVFVNQYIRSAAAPTLPGATSASYNFDTTTFTPTSGWSIGVPAAGSPTLPVWASTAQFYVSSGAGTDSSTTWTSPQKLAEDGTPGAAGSAGANGPSAIFVNQYIRSAAAPTLPGATSASYNFDTTTFTPTSTWSAGVPAAGSPTLAIWVSTAQFYSADGTGTDSSTTWTSPQKLAEDGTPGATGSTGGDGLSVHVSTIYIRQSSAPSTPTGGSYNFTTTTLTAPSGWTEAIPAADSNPLYSSTATWSITGTSGTDSSTTWSAPINISPPTTTVSDVSFSAVSCNVGTGTTTQQFQVHSDGTVDASTVTSGVYTNQYTWLNVGANTNYEVKMTKISGLSLSSGTLDSWLVPSTTRSWVRTSTSGAWVGQLSVRNATTGSIYDTIQVELDNVTA